MSCGPLNSCPEAIEELGLLMGEWPRPMLMPGTPWVVIGFNGDTSANEECPCVSTVGGDSRVGTEMSSGVLRDDESELPWTVRDIGACRSIWAGRLLSRG